MALSLSAPEPGAGIACGASRMLRGEKGSPCRSRGAGAKLRGCPVNSFVRFRSQGPPQARGSVSMEAQADFTGADSRAGVKTGACQPAFPRERGASLGLPLGTVCDNKPLGLLGRRWYLHVAR